MRSSPVRSRATAWPDVPEGRRRQMSAIRGKDTKPEVLLRSLLHRDGYRFRLHRRDLPGTPDIVFPSRRKAVELRGCFWHQHPGCRKCTVPQTRQDYWLPKLARNCERDRANEQALRELGWDVLVVWECEMGQTEQTLSKVRAFLGSAKSSEADGWVQPPGQFQVGRTPDQGAGLASVRERQPGRRHVSTGA